MEPQERLENFRKAMRSAVLGLVENGDVSVVGGPSICAMAVVAARQHFLDEEYEEAFHDEQTRMLRELKALQAYIKPN